MNPLNNKNVTITTAAGARSAISKPTFENCEGLGGELFEIQMKKGKIQYKTCIQVAGFVYGYAKYHMLSFLYEFLYAHLDTQKCELMYTDTDSYALALSEDNLEKCLLPNKRESFFRQYHKWFPRQACTEHYAQWFKLKCSNSNIEFIQQKCCADITKYDQRTLFLFKIELDDIDCCVSLCAKTYCCVGKNLQTKISSKGIQKQKNFDRLQIMNFVNVLSEMCDEYGINKTFKYIPNAHGVASYRERRKGLPFYFQKRDVLEDCITTIPLYKV